MHEVVRLEVSYRVFEPPAEVLSMVASEGRAVEVCLDGRRARMVSVPWPELGRQTRAAIEERITTEDVTASPKRRIEISAEVSRDPQYLE